MSVVAAVHGAEEMPRWTEWDGATMIVPGRGFACIDVVDAEGDDIGKLQSAFGLRELAVEDSNGPFSTGVSADWDGYSPAMANPGVDGLMTASTD